MKVGIALPWAVAGALELPPGLEEEWLLEVPGWGPEVGLQPAGGAFSVGTMDNQVTTWVLLYHRNNLLLHWATASSEKTNTM